MPEIAVPHDLQIELHDDPRAEAVFLALPPSHQREYIDWILEARRPETRARRVEMTVAKLREKAGEPDGRGVSP
jgi:uncharacterized protein YdeI (YjbR/CyaY-like superfamily)